MFESDSDGLLQFPSPVRLIKPSAMFVVAFLSAHYLFGSTAIALPLAAIPLFLGYTGLLAEKAYTATALMTVGALAWAAVPQEIHVGFAHALASAFQDDASAPGASPDTRLQATKTPTS